jgi:hypothetical protein
MKWLLTKCHTAPKIWIPFIDSRETNFLEKKYFLLNCFRCVASKIFCYHQIYFFHQNDAITISQESFRQMTNGQKINVYFAATWDVLGCLNKGDKEGPTLRRLRNAIDIISKID